MSSRTIVFIHGLFLSRNCWDAWVVRFESRGYACLAIAYPERDAAVADLRLHHPDLRLEALTLPRVMEHHVRVIEQLPEKPILIGHSFGGLLTQLLLQQDLAVCGVAIASMPPRGVPGAWSSMARSLTPAFNPLVPGSLPYLMPRSWFRVNLAHTLSRAELDAAYDEQVVPESRRLMRGVLSADAWIDFGQPRAPLLLIAAGSDRFVPAPLGRSTGLSYRVSPSATSFLEFGGRSHYSVIAGEGWQEVADFALRWANEVQGDGVG